MRSMPVNRVLAASVVVLCVAAAGSARAQSAADAPLGALFDEVRVGVLDHDVRFLGGREHGADFNAELLFTSPMPVDWGNALPDWLAWVAQPRPQLGGDLNSSGYTNQAYLGLSWTVPLIPRVLSGNDRITLDLSVGPSFNNGHLDETDPERKALGSHVLIRGAAELGWHVTSRFGVFVLFEHSSNAHLAQYNQSLNELGMRIGWRF
jgi:lipid A 3-O-deacylase